MATTYSDPNEDDSINWAEPEFPAFAHFEQIDDAVRQPADPGTDTYISDGVGANDDFAMSNPVLDGGNTSEIKVWVRGHVGTEELGTGISGDLYVSDWEGSQNFSFDYSGDPQWKSITFTGTWSEAECAGLKVRLTSDGSVQVVYEMYLEITYSSGGGTTKQRLIGKYW